MGTPIGEIDVTARTMGAKMIYHGINWSWAVGFSTLEKAQEFEIYARRNGYETRGVVEDKHKGKKCWVVQFK